MTARFNVGQRGASLVEFALVLPVFLLLLVGIVFYGIAFVTQQAVNFAAESGAEAAVSVDPYAAPSDAGFLTSAQPQVNGRINKLLSFFPGSPPHVTSGDLVNGRCESAAGDAGAVCVTSNDAHRTVTVRLAPEFNSLWPGFPQVPFFFASENGPQVVSATGTAVVAKGSHADGG